MLSAVISSAHSYPAVPLARQPVHQRCVHPGPLVLGTNPLKSPSPTADRDRTVSRRSKPSSRTTLIGEQPNPWDLLQPQDVMSRHRGAKPPRRCGLLGEISLLSLEYLLSVERWPFHAGPPDHYGRLSSLLELSLSQSGGLVPLHSAADFRPASAHHPPRVPDRDDRSRSDSKNTQGGISRVTPPDLAARLRCLPPILHRVFLLPPRSYSKGS